jgi:hypothetical protein
VAVAGLSEGSVDPTTGEAGVEVTCGDSGTAVVMGEDTVPAGLQAHVPPTSTMTQMKLTNFLGIINSIDSRTNCSHAFISKYQVSN